MGRPGLGHCPLPSGTVMPRTCLYARRKISIFPRGSSPIFSVGWGFFCPPRPEEGLNPHIFPNFSVLAPSIHPETPCAQDLLLLPPVGSDHCPYFSLIMFAFVTRPLRGDSNRAVVLGPWMETNTNSEG